ncbi:alpha/beta fold hydrolase [Jatrophihabitans sp. YIM 134969]
MDDVRVRANGIEIAATVAGEGPPVLLLHGFPHTRALWSEVVPDLARDHRVIAPDLRGLGDTTRAPHGYDARTLAADALALLDALGEDGPADVVGVDAGAPPALVAALTEPGRVRRLVVMESLAGTLPGAEAFLAAGPPWWFGFHAVPDLAETVLEGHEAEYVDWFLRAGTWGGRGVAPDLRDAFVAAYTGRASLRCAFEYYRAMPESAAQIAALATSGLTVPTLAIGAHPVGDALFRQLKPLGDRVSGRQFDECGHLIPLDRPADLVAALREFWA